MHTSIRRIVATAAGIGLLAIAGCSTPPAPIPLPTTSTTAGPTTAPAPATTAVAKPAATPNAKPSAGACPTSPESAPVPIVEPYSRVPVAAQVSIKVNGLPPSSTFVAGAKPVEFSVTVCNSSPVAYPKVSLIAALSRCSCAADSPIQMAEGTMERFDEATKAWQAMRYPAMGSGMDFLGTGFDLGALPKGKSVTVRFRTAFSAKMKDGTGGISASVAGQPGPYEITRFEAPVNVRAA